MLGACLGKQQRVGALVDFLAVGIEPIRQARMAAQVGRWQRQRDKQREVLGAGVAAGVPGCERRQGLGFSGPQPHS